LFEKYRVQDKVHVSILVTLLSLAITVELCCSQNSMDTIFGKATIKPFFSGQIYLNTLGLVTS